MTNNALKDALKILLKLINEKISYQFSFNEKTLPLTKEICFGVCRNYFQLENIALLFLNKKPKDNFIWVSLLIGIYQLRHLNTPDYAAVQETVNLLNHPNKKWAKGLVNAVLRKYCLKKDSLDTSLQEIDTFKYNHPTWLINKIQKSWPNAWERILAANNTHPSMSLRVNNALITTSDFVTILKKSNIECTTSDTIPSGIILHKACKVTELPGFNTGLVSVQDLGAQLAMQLLDLKPNLRVLDACAAPGGKTCHILETESNIDCTALDIENSRLDKLQENLKRLKLSATVKQGDCLTPKSWWDGKLFDRILLDAPCSATGVIRRHPDIKLLRTESDIAKITQVQQKLLQTLWKMLAPQGILVYSTCSILSEENQHQIKDFIQQHTDCQCIDIAKNLGHKNPYGLQILPGENNMDGFFYSVLRKS